MNNVARKCAFAVLFTTLNSSLLTVTNYYNIQNHVLLFYHLNWIWF